MSELIERQVSQASRGCHKPTGRLQLGTCFGKILDFFENISNLILDSLTVFHGCIGAWRHQNGGKLVQAECFSTFEACLSCGGYKKNKGPSIFLYLLDMMYSKKHVTS